ncbi:hypothetical protein MMC12_006684 [Toensbergia leucococca]|nr:hypothetical protein [Toensbergia leucococca]
MEPTRYQTHPHIASSSASSLGQTNRNVAPDHALTPQRLVEHDQQKARRIAVSTTRAQIHQAESAAVVEAGRSFGIDLSQPIFKKTMHTLHDMPPMARFLAEKDNFRPAGYTPSGLDPIPDNFLPKGRLIPFLEYKQACTQTQSHDITQPHLYKEDTGNIEQTPVKPLHISKGERASKEICSA